MKKIIVNLAVVTALSLSGAALAAEETKSKVQPPAATSAVPAPPTAAESVPPSPAQEPQPASKRSTSSKPAKAKAGRSKSRDLTHCLELESNAAIAKCAGE